VRIMLLHLERKRLVALSNSNVWVKGLTSSGNTYFQKSWANHLSIPCTPTHVSHNCVATRALATAICTAVTPTTSRELPWLPSAQVIPTSCLPRQRNS
jgi:hypothetical protein